MSITVLPRPVLRLKENALLKSANNIMPYPAVV